MYGSCATQLDLPSSDLDVVVYGLDNESGNIKQGNTKSCIKIAGKEEDKDVIPSVEHNNNLNQSSSTYHITQLNKSVSSSSHHESYQHKHHQHQFYPPLSTNGYRVVRLSTELEQQSWVVQVKAIPMASVPVIKILADPSRLP